MRERAVSEVISFTLVFSLIALTVGIVYVGGMSDLEQARNAEQIQNAERAFDVFDDNVDDIVQGNAPHRGTEIKLAGAQLTFGSATELNVSTATANSQEPYVANLRPVVYQSDGPTNLVYEAGAVIRTDRSGAVVNAQPPMTFDKDVTLLHFVQTRKLTESPLSVGGQETVLVRTAVDGRKILAGRTSGPYTVTFNVTTARTDVWESTLEDSIEAEGIGARPDPCQIEGDTVVCKFDTQELYVSVTRINVAFN